MVGCVEQCIFHAVLADLKIAIFKVNVFGNRDYNIYLKTGSSLFCHTD